MNTDQKFFKVKMSRIESSHQNLRTDEIEGYASSLPLVGENFILLSKGLEVGVRVVRTTPVTELRDSSFKTQNSTYGFEVIEENVEASIVENYLYNLSDPSVN
jgi:hypothetical protein